MAAAEGKRRDSADSTWVLVTLEQREGLGLSDRDTSDPPNLQLLSLGVPSSSNKDTELLYGAVRSLLSMMCTKVWD